MAKSKKNKSKTSSNKTSVAVRRSPRVERGPPNAAEALEDEAAIDIMITAEKLADQNDQHDPDTAVDGMYTEVDPPLVTPKARKGSLRPGGSTKSGNCGVARRGGPSLPSCPALSSVFIDVSSSL